MLSRCMSLRPMIMSWDMSATKRRRWVSILSRLFRCLKLTGRDTQWVANIGSAPSLAVPNCMGVLSFRMCCSMSQDLSVDVDIKP